VIFSGASLSIVILAFLLPDSAELGHIRPLLVKTLILSGNYKKLTITYNGAKNRYFLIFLLIVRGVEFIYNHSLPLGTIFLCRFPLSLQWGRQNSF